MHRTQTSTNHQHTRISHYKNTFDSYSMFNLLTSDDLLDKVEVLLPNHRERLYPPTETLSIFLGQAMSADRSCQNSVNQVATQRVIGGLSPPSTHRRLLPCKKTFTGKNGLRIGASSGASD